MRFNDKVAIVTGGARGIGRAIAERLAAEGARVTIADVAFPSKLAAPAGHVREHSIDLEQVDRIPDLVRQTVDAFGRLDILVNNAGVEFGGTFFEVTQEVWDRHFAINLRAMFFAT